MGLSQILELTAAQCESRILRHAQTEVLPKRWKKHGASNESMEQV